MTERLESRIERFLRTGLGDFDALALELFAYQVEHNLPYRSFCRASGRMPASVTRWQDIPAVPIGAFKSSELATFPISRAAALFHSSGTTAKTPSRHFLKTLSYYETALKFMFSRHLLSDRVSLPFLILAPAPGEAPHSSLSWMLDVVKRTWGASGSDYFISRGLVDDRRLLRALDMFQVAGKPVALLGTTLGFLTLFEHCEKQGRTFRCHARSRIMDTGGMKTAARNVSREEFLRLVWTYLGIPENDCVSEYGMCEMSSQFYARGTSGVFHGPPWVRTQIIHPDRDECLKDGETGLLRHFDLANVDSVMAIQTEDIGEMREQGFVFKGRSPAAELKGCSVDLETHLKRT